MRFIRRLGALLVSTFVIGNFLALPAHADAPATFLGTAKGQALKLDLLGQDLTFGLANSLVNSTVAAVANASGQALVPGTESKAELSGADGQKSSPLACANALIPDVLKSLLSGGLACSESKVDIKNGAPHAFSQGSVAALDVKLLPDILNQLIDQLTQLLSGVAGTVQQTLDTAKIGDVLPSLNNLLGATPVGSTASAVPTAPVQTLLSGLQLDTATNTLKQLLDALKAQLQNVLNTVGNLLSIRLGASSTESTTKNDVVENVAKGVGGSIDVLPGLLNGVSLLKIDLSSASAKAVQSRSTGKTAGTPTFDPSLATVKLLGVPVAIPGQALTLLAGTPLESVVSLGSGHTVQNADGSSGAVADGVGLQLLKGVLGGIGMRTASVQALSNGNAAIVTPPGKPAALPELAHTGGAAWLPFLGTGLLAASLVTRRLFLAKK